MKTAIRRTAELLLATKKNNTEIGRMVQLHRDTIRRYRVNLALAELSKVELDELTDSELGQLIKGNQTQKRQNKFVEVDFSEVLKELKKPGKTAKQIHHQYYQDNLNTARDGPRPMSLGRFYLLLREHKEQRSPEFIRL